jgi:hypothetical protein
MHQKHHTLTSRFIRQISWAESPGQELFHLWLTAVISVKPGVDMLKERIRVGSAMGRPIVKSGRGIKSGIWGVARSA